MIRQALHHKLALLLFTGALLLWVQIASTLHAVEHPFHSHSENCDTFLQFDHHLPLPAAPVAVAALLFLPVFLVLVTRLPAHRPRSLHPIRGPPPASPC